MDQLRTQVTLALVCLLAILLLADAADCLFLGNHYDVPAALFGLVGTAIGGLYAPELVRRIRGNGNGKGADKDGAGEGEK